MYVWYGSAADLEENSSPHAKKAFPKAISVICLDDCGSALTGGNWFGVRSQGCLIYDLPRPRALFIPEAVLTIRQSRGARFVIVDKSQNDEDRSVQASTIHSSGLLHTCAVILQKAHPALSHVAFSHSVASSLEKFLEAL